MMFLFDWRMGLITLTGLLLFFAVNAAMQRAEQTLSRRKFNADEQLVAKVLEYVQGIAEVKNFDLSHDSCKGHKVTEGCKDSLRRVFQRKHSLPDQYEHDYGQQHIARKPSPDRCAAPNVHHGGHDFPAEAHRLAGIFKG